jgi:hypothetical protein
MGQIYYNRFRLVDSVICFLCIVPYNTPLASPPFVIVSYLFPLCSGRDFVVWAMVTWQTIVQVGHRSTYAPSLLQKLYSIIAITELDATSGVHEKLSWENLWWAR